MCALARGGTVTDNLIPRAYQAALDKRGIGEQRQRDALTQQQTTQAIREIKEEVGEGNARRLPLGKGATAIKDYRTEANRVALGSWLYRFFAGEFEQVQISLPLHRGDSRTGAELSPKLITKAELDTALAYLQLVHRDWYDVIERYYQYADIADPGQRIRPKRSMASVAKECYHSRRAVSQMIELGLNMLITYLWQDVP